MGCLLLKSRKLQTPIQEMPPTVVKMAHPRLKGFRQTTNVEKALERFFANVTVEKLNSELVSPEEAFGRVLAEDAISKVNVPSHDRAAMDGYAVVAVDTFGSSQTSPALLSLVNRVDMGKYPTFQLRRGEIAEIATGAVLPAGADAVVMLEYARKIDEKQAEILIPVTPGENVSKAEKTFATVTSCSKKEHASSLLMWRCWQLCLSKGFESFEDLRSRLSALEVN